MGDIRNRKARLPQNKPKRDAVAKLAEYGFEPIDYRAKHLTNGKHHVANIRSLKTGGYVWRYYYDYNGNVYEEFPSLSNILAFIEEMKNDSGNKVQI